MVLPTEDTAGVNPGKRGVYPLNGVSGVVGQ
jgi:hypothetical protein